MRPSGPVIVLALLMFLASGTARAQDKVGDGLLPEPAKITRAIEFFDERVAARTERDGFYLDLGNMITGAGFITAGPGYRHHLLGGRAVFRTSAVLSMRLYTAAHATFELPRVGSDRLKIGAQTLWQDAMRVNFFGLGTDSLQSTRSGYRLQSNDVVGYAVYGPRALSVTARAGYLQPVHVLETAGPDPQYPNAQEIFTDSTAPGLETASSFIHGDVAVAADRRDYPGRPTRGGLYQASWSVYGDQGKAQRNFQRFDIDVSQFVPVLSSNWVIALRGQASLSAVPDDGPEMPFYLMPNLGGRNLRGYSDFRFHDRNLQAYSIESRVALFDHVDTAVFADLGNVAHEASQLQLSNLKRSYGVGIRIHNNKRTIVRFDVAHSIEGWHFIFKLNDPFGRVSQNAGRPPVIPFVP